MQIPDLARVADRAVVFAGISQQLFSDHLVETLGDDFGWDADMAAGTLTFSSDRGAIETRCDMFASIAPGPRSLLWAWAHPQGSPDSVAGALRAYGEENDVPALREGEVPLPAEEPGESLEDAIGAVSHQAGQAMVAVTGRTPYYSAPAGQGTRVVFLLSGHPFPTPRIDVTFPRLLSTALQQPVHDHRNAIHFLADRSGWSLDWRPDWSAVTLTDPVTSTSAVASFDHLARLANLEMSLHP